MNIQSKSSFRLLQAFLAVALLSLGLGRASASTLSSSAQNAEIAAVVNTETHFIYPGIGIGDND